MPKTMSWCRSLGCCSCNAACSSPLLAVAVHWVMAADCLRAIWSLLCQVRLKRVIWIKDACEFHDKRKIVLFAIIARSTSMHQILMNTDCDFLQAWVCLKLSLLFLIKEIHAEKSSNRYGVPCPCIQAVHNLLNWARNQIPLLDLLDPVLNLREDVHLKIVWWNFTTMGDKIRVAALVKLSFLLSFLVTSYGCWPSITDALIINTLP